MRIWDIAQSRMRVACPGEGRGLFQDLHPVATRGVDCEPQAGLSADRRVVHAPLSLQTLANANSPRREC
jgi:hypothetical protein